MRDRQDTKSPRFSLSTRVSNPTPRHSRGPTSDVHLPSAARRGHLEFARRTGRHRTHAWSDTAHFARRRGFSDRDRAGALPVAVINGAYAKAYFNGSNPVGQRLTIRRRPHRCRPASPNGGATRAAVPSRLTHLLTGRGEQGHLKGRPVAAGRQLCRPRRSQSDHVGRAPAYSSRLN